MTDFFEEFDPNSPFEAVIAINYTKSRAIITRDFFSKYDDPKIYSRDYSGLTTHNAMTLKIEPTQKQWISNWNKPKDTGRTQNSNFEAGYSLIVRFDFDDTNLRRYVIDRLSEFGFGSLPSSYTLHCHKDNPHPTDTEAKEILQSIIQGICKYNYLGFDVDGIHRNGTLWDDNGFNKNADELNRIYNENIDQKNWKKRFFNFIKSLDE